MANINVDEQSKDHAWIVEDMMEKFIKWAEYNDILVLGSLVTAEYFPEYHSIPAHILYIIEAVTARSAHIGKIMSMQAEFEVIQHNCSHSVSELPKQLRMVMPLREGNEYYIVDKQGFHHRCYPMQTSLETKLKDFPEMQMKMLLAPTQMPKGKTLAAVYTHPYVGDHHG